MSELSLACHFERRIPACNCARYYRIEVVPTLFGDWSLRRMWGRIGTRGQARIELFPTRADALRAARGLEMTRSRRGYIRLVEPFENPPMP